MRLLLTIWLLSLLGLVGASAFADSDLRPLLPPVGDQANRNTCSAFEAVLLAEFLLEQKTGTRTKLSENYNYWAAKNFALNTPYLESTYAHVDGMAGFLAVEALHQGLLKESDWPYEVDNGVTSKAPGCTAGDETVPTECFTGTPPKFKKPVPINIRTVFVPREEIKTELDKNHRPVLLNIHWYFKNVDKKGNVRMPTAQEEGACVKDGTGCGGHVVALVGYTSQTKRYIFRSSWGANWGTQGYGTMPEKFVLEQCEACQALRDPNLPQDDRDFLEKAAQGVTAELFP